MRWNRFLAVLATATLTAGHASAVGIMISGPGAANVGDTVSFTVALDGLTNISGYELFAEWDSNELLYVPDLDGIGGVRGNLFVSDAIPFVTPTASVPAGPDGGRFSALQLFALPATNLFQLDFEVLAGVVNDGLDFIINLSTGGGVSGPPGSGLVPLDGSAGVEVNLGSVEFAYLQGPPEDFEEIGSSSVPEPAVMALALAGMLGLGFVGRRR